MMFIKAATASLLLTAATTTTLVGAQPTPVVTPMDYQHDGVQLQGYYSEPESFEGLLPAVVFIPDWDGVNLYEQQRATMVAQELGWASFAADIYGRDLHNVSNFTQRVELATTYRGDASLFANRIQSAIELVRGMPNVDPEKVAIVGFCFGGTGVLQYAMQGVNDVTAIVSIHGGLGQVLSQPADFEVTPPILILSGGEDDASSDIMTLEKTLDSVNATWEITRYSDIVHAWTVFGSDAYDEFADMRTWDSMVHWLQEVFGFTDYESLEPDMPMVEAVNYMDVDGHALTGYLAIPDETKWTLPAPAVVLIPDWDGVNEYEQKRATLLADAGYVAFAADIYGSDLQTDLSFDIRREQSSLYRGDKELFVQRMAAAVELLKAHPDVDNDNIAMFGYCFGGTGIIYYAFSERDDVKLVASFHGGLANLPEVMPEQIVPYVLVLSGGDDDDAHGNQTVLEEALDSGNAKWEISRWSGVDHGFTSWTNGAYNVRADIRSWEQTMTAMEELMESPKPASDDDVDDSAASGYVGVLAGLFASALAFLFV